MKNSDNNQRPCISPDSHSKISMDSATKSFNVSTKINLIENPQPSLTKRAKKYLRNPRFIFFSLLILLTILASAIVLSSILRKETSPSFQTYLSKTRKYYCNLTPHRRLCYESLSSVINVTALTSNPGLIFSASIQVSINQLNNTTVGIAKALSLTRSNSTAESSFRSCKDWVLDSLSQLNKSLTVLGVDSDVRSLTYVEMDDIRVSNMAASANALNCYRALQGVAVREEKTRVEQVKSGVWKASKYISNSQGLFDHMASILFDYYNPFLEDDTVYIYTYEGHFDYTILVCMYSGLYLFLALLYFLVWRS